MHYKQLLLLPIVMMFLVKSYANQQDSTARKFKYNQAISLSILGSSINLLGFSHSKILKENPKGLFMRQINLSYYKTNGYEGYNEQIMGAFSISKQFGTGNHHLIIGLGHSLVYSKKSVNYGWDGWSKDEKQVKLDGYAFGILGYSYLNPNKRFYLNASFYPSIYLINSLRNRQTLHYPMPGLIIGYAFGQKARMLDAKSKSDLLSMFTIGYEISIGQSKADFNVFGKSKGITWNNGLALIYAPTRIYYKFIIGYSVSYYDEFKKDIGPEDPQIREIQSTSTVKTKLFDGSIHVWNFGAGLGYNFIEKGKWRISSEALIGTLLNNKLLLDPIPDVDGIALSENVNHDYSFFINEKWYTSIGAFVKRKITDNLLVGAGCTYKCTRLKSKYLFDLNIEDNIFSLTLYYKIK